MNAPDTRKNHTRPPPACEESIYNDSVYTPNVSAREVTSTVVSSFVYFYVVNVAGCDAWSGVYILCSFSLFICLLFVSSYSCIYCSYYRCYYFCFFFFFF